MGKSKDKESKKGKVQMVTKSVRKSHARKAKKGGGNFTCFSRVEIFDW